VTKIWTKSEPLFSRLENLCGKKMKRMMGTSFSLSLAIISLFPDGMESLTKCVILRRRRKGCCLVRAT